MNARSQRWRPGRWPLRVRLVVAMVALLAAVSGVVGVVSVLALDRFLTDRLDVQLAQALDRSRHADGQPHAPDSRAQPGGVLQQPGGAPQRPDGLAPSPDGDGHAPAGPDFLLAPGQGQGTVGLLLENGRVTAAGVLDGTGQTQPLTAYQMAALAALSTSGRPETVDLGPGLGRYRVLAAAVGDGRVLVTGLPLHDVTATVVRLAVVIAGVALLGLLAAGFAGSLIIRVNLRPLLRMAATASRVAELPLDRGEVALALRVPEADTDPRTEVGQVGAALNRMLGHVARALAARQASEARVRRFVSDASHELRTPLASIRGYAELTRRGGGEAAPVVAHALARVESEAVRMSGLVDDMLLLARLDEGRPLDADPVDLTAMVIDAVSDAHAAAPRHRWALDVPEEPVVVSGDTARLHQVVANLLANARVHTPAGTTVTVSVTADGREGTDTGPMARLRVEDDGPGIPGDLVDDVFERFARGDASRGRSSGSTGLGLAIVNAVVHAHEGRTGVTSIPGHTRFDVHLPLLTLAGPTSDPVPRIPAASVG